MNTFVAVTDRDWFDFLSGQPDIDEVNFWQPRAGGGHFKALRRGEPLLFKLKTPVNAIAGGGYFEYYAKLPMSLAWDAFGIKNGAASRQAVWDRIARLRRTRPEWYEDFTIGCIVLVEPFFWPEELWIPQRPHVRPDHGFGCAALERGGGAAGRPHDRRRRRARHSRRIHRSGADATSRGAGDVPRRRHRDVPAAVRDHARAGAARARS